MKTPKISIGFQKKSDAALALLTAKVITAMSGNVNFPTPSPTLAVITAASDAFDGALIAANGGGKIQTADKKQKRIILEAQLHLLASYVEDNSQGNETILLSSGFELQKTGTSAPPEKPTDVAISDGAHSGEVVVKFTKPEKVICYVYRKATTADGLETAPSSEPFFTASFEISGLTTGETIWVAVKAYNRVGNSSWSDPATLSIVR